MYGLSRMNVEKIRNLTISFAALGVLTLCLVCAFWVNRIGKQVQARLAAVLPEQIKQIANDAADTTAKGNAYFTRQLETLNSPKNQKALEAGWQFPAVANGAVKLITKTSIPEFNEYIRELRLQTALTGASARNAIDGVTALTSVLGDGSQQMFAKINRLLDSHELLELLPRVKALLESTTATVDETRAIAAELAQAAKKSPAIAKETEQVLIDAQNFLRASAATSRQGTKTLDAVKKATWLGVLVSLAGLFF